MARTTGFFPPVRNSAFDEMQMQRAITNLTIYPAAEMEYFKEQIINDKDLLSDMGSITMEQVQEASNTEEETTANLTALSEEPTQYDEAAPLTSNETIQSNETFSNDETTSAAASGLTLREWREELHESVGFDGNNVDIFIDRSNDFVHELLQVYDDPNLELYQMPYIHFVGEAGEDGGGLRKEYFWLGMTALRDGKFDGRIPYFEGENDFKLPSCDAAILESGHFKLIGKFMLHSAIHTGIGFVGLSNVVVQYMMMDKYDYESSIESYIEINIRDLPDLELRNVVESIDEWLKTGKIPRIEDLHNIQEAALEFGFRDPINLENLALLRTHVLYFHVIEKRRSQLDCLREAFQESELVTFLRGRDYLWAEIFPRSTQFMYSASVIIDKIAIEPSDDAEKTLELVGFVKQYILEKLDGTEGIQNLVTAWTGSPDLPEGMLEIQMTDYGDFMIHTCCQMISIPANYLKEDVYRDLDMVLKFACYGFGSN